MRSNFDYSKNVREVNDETPDNFTRMGNGHKEKLEPKYTDGEPPDEDETEVIDAEKEDTSD
ncbi:hypothetical protein [Odoribacter laneus]|uniref:hypothetical protein n=1 Tax=Odoribacter laneus TaxID=626933 RepID=UPI00033B5E3D|nr:hypothetical protein [Odoribacter laneus]CCZ80196.1 putative uncharacterized protein [Odoribacter laneus CAG:561]